MTSATDSVCPKRRLRRAVAEMFGIEEHLLPGASRRRPVVQARYAFAYVARTWWPDLSYPRIGRLLGGRDHSTVLHGLRQFEEWRARDRDLQDKVARLLASRLSDQHNAHVRAWSDVQAERERAAERQRKIALFATVVSHLTSWNWWGVAIDYTSVMVADTLVTWLLAGFVIAWAAR